MEKSPEKKTLRKFELKVRRAIEKRRKKEMWFALPPDRTLSGFAKILHLPGRRRAYLHKVNHTRKGKTLKCRKDGHISTASFEVGDRLICVLWDRYGLPDIITTLLITSVAKDSLCLARVPDYDEGEERQIAFNLLHLLYYLSTSMKDMARSFAGDYGLNPRAISDEALYDILLVPFDEKQPEFETDLILTWLVNERRLTTLKYFKERLSSEIINKELHGDRMARRSFLFRRVARIHTTISLGRRATRSPEASVQPVA